MTNKHTFQPNAQTQAQDTQSHLLSNKLWLGLAVWLLVMLAATASLVWQARQGLSFDTSIMSLLPKGQANPAADFANDKLTGNASQQLLLIASGDRQQSLQDANMVTAALRQSGLFKQVQGKADSQQVQAMLQSLAGWRYQHLTSEDRRALAALDLTADDPTSALSSGQPDSDSANSELVNRAIGRLYSPLGGNLAQHLVDDPLQLFDHWRQQAIPDLGIQLQDDWPTRIEHTDSGEQWHRIIVAELDGSPFAMGYQAQVSALLHNLEQASQQLSYTGLIVHATWGANQARQEISTIGALSMAGIVLLMLLVFRRLSYLLLVFLPLLGGCVLAMAASLLIFDRVHMITLAFGASLVGVAIDYSLHFLCHRLEQVEDGDARYDSHNNTPDKHSQHSTVVAAITLGMISSVLAYLAQAAAPFPGLQQMAVFSALGLVGAWLTVIGLLPWLTRRLPTSARPQKILAGLDLARQRWPRIHQPLVATVIVILALVALIRLPQLPFDDSIVRLQTSPLSLLQTDQRVNQIAGGTSWARYLLVSGSSEQDLLQNAEQLQPALEQLRAANNGLRIISVSQQLASLKRQQANTELQAATVYQHGGLLDQFLSQLGASELASAARDDFNSQRQQQVSPEQWLASPLSDSSRHLWLGQFDGRFYSVINMAGQIPADINQQLQQAIDDSGLSQQVVLVDQPAAISTVLSHYRHSMLGWIVLAYLAVLVLLTLKYRLQAWRVVAGPALASLLTLSLLSALGMQLTVFNLLALLLVLGIGLDAGIFLINSRNSLYTWLAVFMSGLTTLLAFGLLALSNTPVLMYFGSTVLCGVILVWLLTPVFTLQRHPS